MDGKDLIPRIGTFFIIMSVGFILLFAISSPTDNSYFDYLFIGIFLAVVGFLLRRKAKPPPPTNRFSMFNKMRDKDNRKE